MTTQSKNLVDRVGLRFNRRVGSDFLFPKRLIFFDEIAGMSRAAGKCTSGAEQNCTRESRSKSLKVSWSAEAWF